MRSTASKLSTITANLKVAVVIPTYKRAKKLERCLNSLVNQTYRNFTVFVYCDNKDSSTTEYFKRKKFNFKITWAINSKHEYVIGAWNKFFSRYHEKYDAVLWCVDDVELYPNCIEEAVYIMSEAFPDTDGVIGLMQECPGHPEYTFKWYGQCLLGKKFIQRYKEVDYKVCCPDYKHFYQDEEMYMYANSVDRFFRHPLAKMKHYHPGFVQEEMDETHPIVRGDVKRQDDEIYRLRREKGLVWGQSFKLIGEKK